MGNILGKDIFSYMEVGYDFLSHESSFQSFRNFKLNSPSKTGLSLSITIHNYIYPILSFPRT